jgi:hypothetical protein
MGITTMQWYIDRGLTKKKIITFTEDSLTVKFGKNKPGETIEIDEPTEYYSCGRIDVRGTDEPFGEEIAVPPMRAKDWNRFSAWLFTCETDDVWTLAQLVEMYEKTNAKIVWRPDE